MAQISTLSGNGKITVPREIREHLGLEEGDRVEFAIENDQIIFRREYAPENVFLKYQGILPAFKTRKEINSWIANLRDSDVDE